MSFEEPQDFPRGGKGGQLIKKKRNFMNVNKGSLPKPKKPGRRERKRKFISNGDDRGEEEDDSCNLFERFEPLTYRGLSEGTVAMCSVREIFPKYVDMSMPGRLSARLYLENVSEPYASAIKKEPSEEEEKVAPLSEIFRVGQRFICSVLSTKQTDNHFSVQVSSNPALVNNTLKYDNVGIGRTLQMAVTSIEDHGYMMFSGITGLIAFLPKDKAELYVKDVLNAQSLRVGEIVWCVITSSNLSLSSNSVQVSIDYTDITNNKLEEDITMDKLCPGVRVNVSVNKVVSQNLLVSINGTEIWGYIEESQFSSTWSKIEDFQIGSLHTATVLYKFPYAKIVALTLKSDVTSVTKANISLGTIFKHSEIMTIRKRGVCVKLMANGKPYMGMVSVRRMGKDNLDYEKISEMFPLGNHITCRVIGYDALEDIYSVTTEDNILNEKYLSSSDIEIGQVVDITVESFEKGGVSVKFGALKGFVPLHHISDTIIQNARGLIKLNSIHKAKVLHVHKRIVLTLRPTLVKTPSLTDFGKVQVGEAYYGTVTIVQPTAIRVTFFNGLISYINQKDLLEMPHKYTVGQLVKCYVVATSQSHRPILSLVQSVQNMTLTVGNKYSLIVKEVSSSGLTCVFVVQSNTYNGFLPVSHLCDFDEYKEQELQKYSPGTVVNGAVLLSINEKIPLFTLKSTVTDFFEENPQIFKGFMELKKGMLLPCSVSDIFTNRIHVCAPLPGFNGKIPILKKNLHMRIRKFSVYQELVAKTTNINFAGHNVELSSILDFEEMLQYSFKYVSKFLNYIRPLQKKTFGARVECKIKSINEFFMDVKITTTKEKGILVKNYNPDCVYKLGQVVEAVVLFHDVKENIVYLHPDVENVNIFNEQDTSLQDKVVDALLLHVGKYITLAVTDEPGKPCVFLPTNLDPNNLGKASAKFLVPFTSTKITLRAMHCEHEGGKAYYRVGFINALKESLSFEEKPSNILSPSVTECAMKNWVVVKQFKNSVVVKNKRTGKVEIRLVKNMNFQIPGGDENTEEIHTEDMDDSINAVDNGIAEESVKVEDNGVKVEDDNVKAEDNADKQKKRKKDSNIEAPKAKKVKTQIDSTVPMSLDDFDWSGAAPSNNIPEEEDLQDSEEEIVPAKKMTAAEKRAAAMEAENLVREKEQELLNSESNPQSAEHFDRLLTASPNNSKLWIMYMAFHMQSKEIEKARAVAKRALKRINVRLEAERRNVWIASLNLENISGTADSFKEVLTEALKYNDNYEIYKRVLDMYAESEKLNDLEKLAYQLVKKYKDNIECWIYCQTTLMKAGLHDKARIYLQRSLEALPSKEYCNLVSRFALIEHKFGFTREAQTLFENLLTSYPKRVDILSVYVDMLVKGGTPDLARDALERATSQTIPLRKMKAIYQKWLKLEEEHGTPESVKEVKEAAANYVDNIMSGLKDSQ